MTELVYTHMDKADWGDGPWQSEPDKIQWVDQATDLDCLIVRGPMAALCGYVGVPATHPCYGKDYNDVDVSVHGGLTFADKCMEDLPEGQGVCHVPFEGRTGDIWWLGFDCGHSWDLIPRYAADPTYPRFGREVYRDVDYVRGEVTSLAAQLAAVAREASDV